MKDDGAVCHCSIVPLSLTDVSNTAGLKIKARKGMIEEDMALGQEGVCKRLMFAEQTMLLC